MVELARALNRHLKGMLNRAKPPRSGHYDGPDASAATLRHGGRLL